MTAEIAIMNAQAVALAADSAVTFGSKVKNTANKIFALSKFEPVAAMIYNNAEFFGLPWETVLKTYRGQLGTRSFGTVAEYAQHFIEYVRSDALIRSAIHDPARITTWIGDEYIAIRDKALEHVDAQIAATGAVDESRISELLDESVKEHDAKLREAAPTIAADLTASVDDEVIAQLLTDVFADLPLLERTRKQLRELARYIVRVFPVEPLSGLVVAGFGRDELYPAIESFELFVFADESFVAVRDDRSMKMTNAESAYIVPFAQTEVVATFMDGVDPRYQALIDGLVRAVLREYPKQIINQIVSISDEERTALVSQFTSAAAKVAANYLARLGDVRAGAFSSPITSVVQSLPKDELAAMAEALVNLTAFRRKISLDRETVGGPIDVAVISKGDGLVWIKRKHYFEPRFNPQFFELYYWRERHAESEAAAHKPE